ncbi:hypothetical protein JCM11251_000149 [Rhodosporidiobolus azoricus]
MSTCLRRGGNEGEPHLYSTLRLDTHPAPPTAHEIKQAYRALILQAHPDRRGASSANQAEGQGEGGGAEELNLAYEVLSDEERRREYDEARAAYLSSLRSRQNPSAYALSLSLDAFDPHGGEDDDPAYYTHPCRCSNEYRISREQLEDGVEVVVCEGCSERCRVEYEVVEE